MTEPFIQMNDIGLHVDKPVKVQILDSIDLEIQDRSAVAIVGPSSAGKTTLAVVLGGLVKPTTGSYHFDNKVVHGFSNKEYARFRRENIGFVFQLANLIDERSALNNVAIGLGDYNLDTSEIQARCRAALEAVGLSAIAGRQAALLSGGERQRVAIARALVKKPRMVIADEPTGSLDQATGTDILRLLQALPEAGTILVLVTHAPHAAEMMDRKVEILDGKLYES